MIFLVLFSVAFVAAVTFNTSASYREFDSSVRQVAWLPNSISTAFAVTSAGQLFVSFDAGQSWQDRSPPLGGRVSRVETNVAAPRVVYAFDEFVSATLGSAWRSVDGGQSFQQAADKILEYEVAPLSDGSLLAELRAGAGCGERALGIACFTELHVSNDSGASFHKLLTYVESAAFSPFQPNRLMVTTWLERTGDQRDKAASDLVLLRVDNVQSPATIAVDVLGHGISSQLYVGGFFLMARSQPSGAFVMLVSRDEQRFDEVQFRGNAAARQFTILAATNSSLLVAAVLENAASSDVGSLFVSDFTGVHMKLITPTLSRQSAHVYDFSRVDAAEGVFLANFDDATHVSVDGGATFARVALDINGTESALLLEQRDGDNYRQIYVAENAPGVVLSVARIGAESHAVASYDFGRTWMSLGDYPAAQLLAGTSLAVVPERFNARSLAAFRLTGGVDGDGGAPELVARDVRLFGDADDDTPALLNPRVSAPTALGARTVLVWARLAGSKRVARVEFVDALPPCTEANVGVYSGLNGGECALGRRLSVRRIKPSAPACRNELIARSNAYTATPCACTLDDYQCQVGYAPASGGGALDCKLVVDTPPPTCLAPSTYDRASYRLKPGNVCVNESALPLPPIERDVVCPSNFTCDCGTRTTNTECVAHGVCQCDDGWAGAQCNKPLFRCLASSCGAHGQCRDAFTCDCQFGWGGIDCSDDLLAVEPDAGGVAGGLTGVQIFFVVAGVIAGVTIIVAFIAMIYLRFYGGRRFLHLRETPPDELQSARE